MKLINLPAFLFGVFLVFWCFELGALLLFIQFWKLGQRNDVKGV
jgi:hypothetical protein